MAIATIVILLATSVPVLWGYLSAPPEYHYIGFAYNWEEANSYLAKIVQGVRGQWLYFLPYNADPGEPFFLYANYLLLGHLSRWLSLEPIAIFHSARLAGGALLFVTLYWFAARFFAEVRERRLAFGLAATGAGFGWLALLASYHTADVWQTQIFPFLAVFANVHFPPAMAGMLWLCDALVPAPTQPIEARRLVARLLVATLLLSLTQPYALVIAAGTGGLWFGWRLLARAPRNELVPLAGRLMFVTALAAPFALYYRWLGSNNAAYAGWDRQNITLSSPPWDYALAFGLMLVLAAWGVVQLLRRWRAGRGDEADAFLLFAWITIAALCMALPIAQQRRFGVALTVPVALLAVHGARALPMLDYAPRRFAVWLVSSLTPILLLALALGATALRPSYLYFTQGEWEALQFLKGNAPPEAVVLASSDMGLYIPAWAGQRVLYGHPHETLNALEHKAEVDAYFRDTLAQVDTIHRRVDYVFVGPRERAAGPGRAPEGFVPVFRSGDVTIYRK